MEWISHRGESIDAPENTLSAFQLAMERDTDGIETDIHYFSHNCLPPDHVSAAKKRGITKRYPSLDCLYLSVSDSVGLIKYNCILTDYSALYKYYFADI